ncbi:MAG: M28 family peptidase, partial [candidate division WOR-3 bacterium]
MKKLCAVLLMVSALSFSTQLVRVELGTDRLMPLFDRGLSILAEFETWALLYVADHDMFKLESHRYTVLETDPVEGVHYLVKVLDPEIDMGVYGTILTSSDNDVLVRIHEGMLEPLIRNRVQVKRVFFTPLHRGGGWSGRFTYDPLVQNIVDMVDPDSVLACVQRLQDFRSRYSTYDSCFAAATYIANKFSEYGCDSVYFQYHTGGHAPNVIAVKRGIVQPDSIYAVVCGHFDATSSMAPTVAPGADDNASGTASTIEAARVMKDFLFEHSIRYMAFSGEEFGLYGSEYYAAQAYAQGDSILGVLNADMIAYANTLPESLEVIGKISNPPCETFADFFIACADSYTTLLTDKHMTSSWIPSDNQSFLDYGYVALCNIEDYGLTNPHYHQPSDTIGAGYNNNDFCTEVIKAQVAALAVMAVPSTSVYLQLVDFWIVDTAYGGNGNGWWESGEEVDLVVRLYNAGIDTSFNTYAVLNTSDPYATIIEDSVHVGILLPRDTTEVSFRVGAAVSAPSGHLVDFNLIAGTTGDSWDYGFSMYINPLPLITFQFLEIIGGNGNGILDPGETADVAVTVKNEGHRDALDVTLTLQSGSSYLSVDDGSGYIDFIAIDDTASNAGDPFTVTADSGASYGTDVW